MYETFEEWYDSFQDHVNRLGYDGPIDKESFESDFEEGKEPSEVAEEFVKEMNE